MLEKMKNLMGFTIEPEYEIYFKCTKTSCGYIDKDGWYRTGYEEYECHVPGSCYYYQCGC